MKPWKYVLLAAGLLGAIAIFMPMVTIRKGFFEQDFSTRDLVFNGEQTRQTLNGKIPKIAMQHLPKSLQSLRSDLQDVLLAARALSAVFVPAMLLLLLGGFAVYRERVVASSAQRRCFWVWPPWLAGLRCGGACANTAPIASTFN